MRRAPAIFHVLLLSCIWLSLAGVASADLTNGDMKKNKKDKNAKIIPEARDATVKFGAGQSVVIELTAAVGSLKQVDFTIRTQPEHGTLSAVKPHSTDNNKALVTYTHREGEPLSDSFTFSCKLEDNPSSAPATITLVGQVLLPKLEVKESPHLGKLAPGDRAVGKVVLKNSGLVPFTGEIKWPAPWTGPPRLEIKAGETQEFMIAVQPTQAGVFRLDLELQPGVAASKLMSYAECERALTISPGELTLAYNTVTGAREGLLTLLNGESTPVTVVIKMPALLTGPARVDLQPHERREMIVGIPATSIEAFRGEIQFDTGPELQRVTVQSAPKPGELQLIKPVEPEIDLGKTNPKSVATGVFTIRNTGGESLIVEPGTYPPLSLDVGNNGFRLAPKEEKQITVRLEGAPVGVFNGAVKLTAGSTSIPITIKAAVSATAPLAEKETTPGPGYNGPPILAATGQPLAPRQSNRLVQIYSSYLGEEGLPPPEQALNRDLPRVEKVEGIAATPTTVTIAWKKPAIVPPGWVVENGDDFLTDKKTAVQVRLWKPWKKAKIIEDDKLKDKIVLNIFDLKPNKTFTFRVMALDRDGKVSVPSPKIKVFTTDTWHMPQSVIYGFIIAVLLAMLYFLNRMRRGDFPAFA